MKKLDKLKEKEYFPLSVFAVINILFSLTLTRQLIKMDDGNFLGILADPDFTYFGWLKERYLTCGGRTASEFCTAFFLGHSFIWWQIFNALTIVYIASFMYRISKAFCGEFSLKEKQIFCATGIFLMFVSCLNPAVFWPAGSFTFLWTFSATAITLSPLLFYILEEKFDKRLVVPSFIAALLSCSQEQTASCTIAFYFILTIIVFVKKQKFKLSFLLPLPTIAIGSYLILSSPGRLLRMENELKDFERFSEMNLIEKLYCGLSSFYANSFFVSNFLIILFVALISLLVFERTEKSKKFKNLLISANVFVDIAVTVINYSVSFLGGGLAHTVVRFCFKSGEFTLPFYILFAVGTLILAVVICLSVYLVIKDRKTGFSVALCLAAGFCSAMIMGFSSSIFNSGQRVYFITNMFVIMACVIILSSLKKTRASTFAYKSAIKYAAITFIVNCVAFRIIEHPLMG